MCDGERVNDQGPALLGRTQILRLLDEVADEAARRDVHIDLFLIGGAAMAVAYSETRITDDIDGVFEPRETVIDIARVVGARHGLPATWLNDHAKAFLPEYREANLSLADWPPDDPHASVHFERPGLAVRVASPRYLFVLKALAARESDEEDLRVLWPLCGFRSAADGIAAIEQAYPDLAVKPNVRRLVEGLASS